MMKDAKEKQDKQLDRVQQKVCSAELKLAEEHAVRFPAQASASAAGTSEASTKREALNVTRQLEMNTKTLAALQRASKQATTAKTAAQAKANNPQVKIDRCKGAAAVEHARGKGGRAEAGARQGVSCREEGD
jgi:hypothetical protein